jgi:hypothetical protein
MPATTSPSPTASAAVADSTTADWTMPSGKEIDVFGDSMAVGSIHALRYYLPGIRVDGKSNRQWSAAPQVRRRQG